MSEDGFDLDRALMQYLREDYAKHGSRMVAVTAIAQHLAQHLGRDVPTEQVAATALRTRYTQRAADGRVTRIPPYHLGYRNGLPSPADLQLTQDAYERPANYGL